MLQEVDDEQDPFWQLIEPLLHLSRCVARGRTCLKRLLPLPRQCRHPRFGAVEENPLLTKAPDGIGGDLDLRVAHGGDQSRATYALDWGPVEDVVGREERS